MLLVFGLIAAMLFSYKTSHSVLNPISWKIIQSWTLLEMENANFWRHIRQFGALFILAFAGFPSAFLLFLTMFLWKPLTATLLVVIAHFMATCVLAIILRKSEFKVLKVESDLLTNAKRLNLSAEKLAFFSRVFFTLPLRTGDRMIAYLKSPEESFIRILGYSFLGTAVRIIPQSLWISSLLDFIINFRPYPDYDISRLLFYSAVMIAWFLWPRIPELMPSREDIGEFFLEINKEKEFSPMLKKPESQKTGKPSPSLGF